MAHSHSTQTFILETLNGKNLSYIHYIEFHLSLYNIYNVFRYFIDTKTLIPKTGIIFSKPLKIVKNVQFFFGGDVRNQGGHTYPPWDPPRKAPGTHDTNRTLL
jgi:hypothetical protein